VRPPPIMVRCDCGEMRDVAYGDIWTCEGCGRRWNTSQIPAAEYAKVVDVAHDLRNRGLVGLAVIGAVFGSLAIVVEPRMLFTAPVAIGLWYAWFWPRHRRRLRERARSLPRWELRPE
jgi:hypothetical protein